MSTVFRAMSTRILLASIDNGSCSFSLYNVRILERYEARNFGQCIHDSEFRDHLISPMPRIVTFFIEVMFNSHDLDNAVASCRGHSIYFGVAGFGDLGNSAILWHHFLP